LTGKGCFPEWQKEIFAAKFRCVELMFYNFHNLTGKERRRQVVTHCTFIFVSKVTEAINALAAADGGDYQIISAPGRR